MKVLRNLFAALTYWSDDEQLHLKAKPVEEPTDCAFSALLPADHFRDATRVDVVVARAELAAEVRRFVQEVMRSPQFLSAWSQSLPEELPSEEQTARLGELERLVRDG